MMDTVEFTHFYAWNSDTDSICFLASVDSHPVRCHVTRQFLEQRFSVCPGDLYEEAFAKHMSEIESIARTAIANHGCTEQELFIQDDDVEPTHYKTAPLIN